PGPRRGHAAARADRRDPRRRRQPGRGFRRQLHHRLRLHLRRGALSAARLRDPFPADDFRHRFPAARPVRKGRGVKLAALALMLALSQVLWGTAYRWVALTDGDNGLRGLSRPFHLDDAASFYYFALAVTAASLWLMARFVGSPFGAALRGTRDQPRRMSAL